MPTTLVTGGCGFIGSHVADRLIADGHQVVVIDDLSSGLRDNLPADAKFHEGQIEDKALIESVFAAHQFDYVIHQAARINTSVATEDPYTDVEISVLGTLNLIEYAVKAKVKKFVYASSVAVYGRQDTLPVAEDCPSAPVYSYGIAKDCAEAYVRFHGVNRGLDYHIVRYGNIYGPRQPIMGEVGVIAIFADRISRGEPLTVFGDGEHLRDFLYVADAVDATIGLLDHPGSSVFNVASGMGTSVNQVLAAFEAAAGRSLKPVSRPERPGELGKFYCDATKIGRALGWRPQVDLAEGIQRIMAGSRP